MRSRKIFSVSPVQETISVLCLILVVAFRSFEGSIFTFHGIAAFLQESH